MIARLVVVLTVMPVQAWGACAWVLWSAAQTAAAASVHGCEVLVSRREV
jgi:hypothetical protein